VNDSRELARALTRAARADFLVARLLAIWSRACPTENVGEVLNCTEDRLVELALCLRPRAEHWDSDISEIATACGIDLGRLDAFLKKVVIAERLALAHEGDADEGGRLLAARDRHDEP
jgi:hypothetical protein